MVLAAARAVADFTELTHYAETVRRALGTAECVWRLAQLLLPTGDEVPYSSESEADFEEGAEEEEEEPYREDTAYAAARALMGLTEGSDPAMCKRVAAGALPALLGCMGEFNYDEDEAIDVEHVSIADHVTCVLERLSKLPELHVQLATDDVLNGLVDVLEKSSSRDANEHAAGALVSLCASHDASVRKRVAHRCTATLLETIDGSRYTVNDTDAGFIALRAIGFLCLLGDDAVRDNIVEHNGIDLMAREITYHSVKAGWCLCSLAAVGSAALCKKILEDAEGVLELVAKGDDALLRNLAGPALKAAREPQNPSFRRRALKKAQRYAASMLS